MADLSHNISAYELQNNVNIGIIMRLAGKVFFGALNRNFKENRCFMDSKKYDRSVVMLCPTCGNSQLEIQNENSDNEIIRCPSCDRSMTKEEFIRENSESIDVNMEEIEKKVIKDIEKEFNDTFKKTFK